MQFKYGNQLETCIQRMFSDWQVFLSVVVLQPLENSRENFLVEFLLTKEVSLFRMIIGKKNFF